MAFLLCPLKTTKLNQPHPPNCTYCYYSVETSGSASLTPLSAYYGAAPNFVADFQLRHFDLILRALAHICSNRVLEPLIDNIIVAEHEEDDAVNRDIKLKAWEILLRVLGLEIKTR